MPRPSASDNTKQTKQAGHPSTPRDSLHKATFNRRKEEKEIKTKITKDQSSAKRRPRKTTFEPAAPVGGTSSIGMFYFLIGLVPRYPQSAFSFLLSSTAVSLLLLMSPLHPAFPWWGFLPLLMLPPLSPFPLKPPTAYAQRCLIRCASFSRHLTMNRSAASRTPRYHFPVFLGRSGPQRGLSSKRHGGQVPLTLRRLGNP